MAKLTPKQKFIRAKLRMLDKEYNSLVRKANDIKNKRNRAEARVEALAVKQAIMNERIERNLDAWFKWHKLSKPNY